MFPFPLLWPDERLREQGSLTSALSATAVIVIARPERCRGRQEQGRHGDTRHSAIHA
jgi:hypothetical protein